MSSETIITQTLPTLVGMGIVARTTDKALNMSKSRRATGRTTSKARSQKRAKAKSKPKRKLIFGNMKTLL